MHRAATDLGSTLHRFGAYLDPVPGGVVSRQQHLEIGLIGASQTCSRPSSPGKAARQQARRKAVKLPRGVFPEFDYFFLHWLFQFWCRLPAGGGGGQINGATRLPSTGP